jgi:protein kinase
LLIVAQVCIPITDTSNIDLRLVSKPSDREITSLTYRSPEVYFKRPWNASTDIWSWGIVVSLKDRQKSSETNRQQYCHLLEAQIEFEKPGMLDSLRKGTMEEKASAVREAIAHDFALPSVPFYSEHEETKKLLPPANSVDDNDWWGEKLYRKGISPEDLQFLVNVLHPDPSERATAAEIVRSGYLEISPNISRTQDGLTI